MNIDIKKTSSFRRLIGAGTAAVAVMALGCSAEVADEDVGAVAVSLSEAACGNADAIAAIEMITVTLTDPDDGNAVIGDDVLNRQAITDYCAQYSDGNAETPEEAAVVFNDVPVGNNYTVTANAYSDDAGEDLIGSGDQTEIEVTHGGTTEVDITIDPIDANGDVAITIDFGAGDWDQLGSGGNGG